MHTAVVDGRSVALTRCGGRVGALVFRDVALSTVTVHSGSDHAELAATAVKHAVDGGGAAHLVLPDEVQDIPSDAPAASPAGRRADLAVAPSPATLDAALGKPVLMSGHLGSIGFGYPAAMAPGPPARSCPRRPATR